MYAIDRWCETNKFSLEGKTFIIQGFGNVGKQIAQNLEEKGMKMIGVGNEYGYMIGKDGIAIQDFRNLLDEFSDKEFTEQSSQKLDNCSVVNKSQFMSTDCDIVILAAKELQVDATIAENMKCSLVVEGANGPVTMEADTILQKKNIDLIPDILANSGGVQVSYYEYLQNNTESLYSYQDINNMLKGKMFKTFDHVQLVSWTSNSSLRDASYYIAMRRIQDEYFRSNKA